MVASLNWGTPIYKYVYARIYIYMYIYILSNSKSNALSAIKSLVRGCGAVGYAYRALTWYMCGACTVRSVNFSKLHCTGTCTIDVYQCARYMYQKHVPKLA